MGKRLVSAMLVLIMLAGCVGCSAGQSTAADDTSVTTADDSKVIKVGWYSAWYLPSDYYDELFDEFETKYPEYTIEKTDVNSISELVSQVQSGTQPDVWLGGDPNNTNLTMGYYEGIFQCLDEYLANDDTVNLNTLDPEQMKLTEFNGKYYGLPVHATQQCLLYNKKLFSEAGLDPEHAPENWDEWYEYIEKLTKYDSNGFITQLGISNGPWVYQLENSDGSTGTFKTDRISSNYDSDWILKLHEFCNKCYAITDKKTAAENVDLDFSNGNIAMVVGDFQSITDIELDREDLGIAYVPKPDGTSENYIPSLLFYFVGMPVECDNPEGGWTFMKYLLTDGMYILNKNRYMEKPLDFIPGQLAHIPTKERVYEDFVTGLSDDTKEFIEKRDTLLKNAEVVVENYSPIQTTLFEIEDKWNEKKENGEVSLKEALLGIYKEYEAQLATWKEQQEAKGWQFPEGKEAIAPDENE
jgi:ABC-type glycerol-3-phosphate transport system substrate-binding protein